PNLASARAINTTLDLDTWEYDIYVPPAYDGSEPYGLVSFINSGGGGAPRGAWQEVLNERKLIWIGPRNAGNSVNVDVRFGAGLLGAARALEQFHIDRSRVYASGNSGGARSASVLAWMAPDVFVGAAPLCGASYFREVDQDYETREPDSHYEFWGSFYYPEQQGVPFQTFALENNQRWAIMTSFGDFREGDIFNIQHNGLRPDGFDVRVLEVGGGHCSTNTGQFDDAIAFLEHLDHTVEDDAFEDDKPRTGGDGEAGWAIGTSDEASVTETDGAVRMDAAGGRAVLLSRTPADWNTLGGVVVRLDLELDDVVAKVSLAANDPEQSVGNVGSPEWPGLHVHIDDTVQPALVEVRGSGLGGESRLLFEASFEPDSADGVLPLEIHAWSNEVQVIVPGVLTVDDTTVALPGSLMNDNRTVRLRVADLESGWTEDDWPSAILAIEASGPGSLTLDRAQLHDDTGLACD
ncbi:MAG: hypothetical protein AB8H79_22975, partial [Myxococcota bacterium]